MSALEKPVTYGDGADWRAASCRALQKAIELCGSQSELARRIGGKVRVGHIYYWLRKGVPLERCPDVARATGGVVPCADLRPDFFRHEHADKVTKPLQAVSIREVRP